MHRKCIGTHYDICRTCGRTGEYTTADYSALRTQFVTVDAVRYSDGAEECRNHTEAPPNIDIKEG